MPNPTAPPESPENLQIKFEKQKIYLRFGKFGLHPGKAAGFGELGTARPPNVYRSQLLPLPSARFAVMIYVRPETWLLLSLVGFSNRTIDESDESVWRDQ